MKKAKNYIIGLLLFSLLLSGISSHINAVDTIDKTQRMMTVSSEGITIDIKYIAYGYITVRKTVDNGDKYKLLIAKDEDTRYCYDIPYADGTAMRYSFSEGSGNYTLCICRHKAGTKYAVVLRTSVSVQLQDEFAPFLTPNMYIDYAENGLVAALSDKLTADCRTGEEKIQVIHDWVTENVSYDYAYAAVATSDYRPDAEDTLLDRDGICSDYAALMVSMLRTAGIPAKVIVGYVGKSQCHAWVEVYDRETETWERMDPTFAACGRNTDSIRQYIQDDSNYSPKYQY